MPALSAHPRPGPLLRRWNALVKKEPRGAAIIEAAGAKTFSFSELDRLAEESAGFVSGFTRHRACRVAFSAANSAAWVIQFLALLKAGAVPVPLDAGEPIARQRELTEAAGARGLWLGDNFLELKTSAPELAGLCVVKLTSGTTGRPRALPFRDEEMLADGRQICATMQIGATDRNLAVIPLGHSYGLGNLVIPLLDQGTGIVLASAPLPHAIAADIERWSPTVFPCVPALLRIFALSDLPPSTFAPLRTIISAGSALDPQIAKDFYAKYHKLIHGFYGSSETGGIAYDRNGEATLAGRSVGQPLRGVRLRFGRGQRFTVESRAAFTRGNRATTTKGMGLVRPVDRAELTPEGELRLLGRAGRLVKIAGRRLDLSELEHALRKIAGVSDAWVTTDGAGEEALAAVVATRLDAKSIRESLRDQVAAWKIPRRVIALKEFPLTRRGKVDTRALQAKVRAGRAG